MKILTSPPKHGDCGGLCGEAFHMKKNSILIIMALTLAVAGCARSVVPAKPVVAEDAGAVYILGEDLRVEMISPGVYLVTHSFPWAANSLVVNLGVKGMVMVDTPYTPAATEMVLAWMVRKFKQLPVMAIATGFHVDNLGGHEALKKRKVPLYGLPLTGELVRTRGAAHLKALTLLLKGEENARYRKSYEALTLTGADIFFHPDSEGSVRLMEGSIDIFYPGPTHTRDNLVVFFREKSLLFGGCMIFAASRGKPGHVADADMKQWPWNVEKVLQRYAGAVMVVPGHGLPGDVSLLRHTIDVLHRFRRGEK